MAPGGGHRVAVDVGGSLPDNDRPARCRSWCLMPTLTPDVATDAARQFLRRHDPCWEDLDLTIHDRDEMFRVTLGWCHGTRDLALFHYLRCGLLAWESLRPVVEPRRGQVGSCSPRLLDFASGYGRTTRFLVQAWPWASVAIAEIDPEAVSFQESRFGVPGFVSTPDPKDFSPQERFDVISVFSLFSHLPRRTFVPWLARLYGLLAAGGVLVFSVHDEDTLGPGRSMPADGFRFEGHSESSFLSVETYGSTWVREEFVARAVAEATGGEADYLRVPRGLWHFQDVYVVGHAEALPMPFDRGVQGYVEVCRRDGEGLGFSGWVVDHGGPLEEITVEVTMDDEAVARCRPEHPREDVAVSLGRDDALNCGWGCRLLVPRERQRPEATVCVYALTRRGRRYPLHAGSLRHSLRYVPLGIGETATPFPEPLAAGALGSFAAHSRRQLARWPRLRRGLEPLARFFGRR